jgi:YD repeat-containing protein
MVCSMRSFLNPPALIPIFLAFCFTLLTGGGVRAQTNNEITYIYDELGRLVGVIDPLGEAVTYTYDAVGNLLSISRRNSAIVSIIEFTPDRGSEGTAVIIYGTGFSPVPAQNTVSFNGVGATVLSASNTQITTTVPAGATTGLITVTTPSGSANSGIPFTIVSAPGTPVIIGFSPSIALPGNTLNISGSNFGMTAASNIIKLNSTFAFANTAMDSNIALNVPTGSGQSGRISVRTQSGTAVSSGDLFVPPETDGGTKVSSTSEVIFAVRMSLGETRTFTTSVSNKMGMVIFDGVAGQRVSIDATGTLPFTWMYIHGPDNQTVASFTTNVGSTSGLIDTFTLPLTGTYTFSLWSNNQGPGTTTVNIRDVTDITGNISIGGPPLPISTNIPGQNAWVSFNGNAGRRVRLTATNVTYSSGATSVFIYNPDGTINCSMLNVSSAGAAVESLNLPVNGVYKILIDPRGSNTGGATLALSEITANITGSIAAGGSSVTATTSAPEQNIQLSFNGVFGQRVSVLLSSVTIGTSSECGSKLTIYKPDGSPFFSDTCVSAPAKFIDTMWLPVSGTYTILLDPQGSLTGSVRVRIYDVPPDVKGAMTVDGSPLTVTVTTPGQNAHLTFYGNQNQRVGIHLTEVTIQSVSTPTACGSKIDFTSAFGNATPQTIDSCVRPPSKFLDITLPVSGTQTITINPYVNYVGSMTVTLSNVPPDVTGVIVAGGAPLTVSTNNMGQNAAITFNGTVGQRVSMDMTGINIGAAGTCGSALTIRDPYGSVLLSDTCVSASSKFIDSFYLSAGGQPTGTPGTYTIYINPYDANTGSITLTLYNVPADVSGPITAGGGAVDLAISTPGQNAALTFSGTAGQRVSLDLTNILIGQLGTCGSIVTLTDSWGGTFATDTCVSSPSKFIDTVTLPAAGTYRINVNPYDKNVGGMTLRLYNVPADVTSSVRVGRSVSVSTTTPGQNAKVTFSGSAGQLVTVRLTNNTMGSVTVTLRKPDGTALTSATSSAAGFDLTTQTLPTRDTYTIDINPNVSNTGSITVSVTNP